MPHDHSHHHHDYGHHHHHHDTASMSDGGLMVAVVINVALTFVQVIGGVLSGSLALIADALHNFSDAASLVIALLARRVARRPADGAMTFGYGRAEIVAALINFTTLILIGLYLAYEAILRIANPEPIEGWTVVVVAGVALVIDAATAALTYAQSRDNMNIRAAFLHNLTDALASVAVIIGGVVVLLYDWTLIDPLLTLAISAYVLWHGASEIGAAIRILMLGTPSSLDRDEVAAAIAEVDGVVEVHHLHLWQFDEKGNSLEAHLVIDQWDAERFAAVKLEVKRMLVDRFGVGHSTLEIEFSGDACCDAGCAIGAGA